MAPERVNLWSVFRSVAAAFFGVQSAKNRERDFTHGKPMHFIVVGLALTAVFIAAVWGAVQLLLRSV